MMDARLDKLTELVEKLNITHSEKEGLLQLIEKIKKEINIRDFELDRAKKAKITLNTLLARTSEDLEKSTELIKKMFGRYLSTEVMNSLLEDPSALEMGGEKRKVTIMMTDLRGFTALSERLKPEMVVQMLNSYFEVMMDVILKYQGTINEIIGDALLVIFGAPQEMPDRAKRAIACAIEMQNAMAKVNAENSPHGLPALEMGVGLNETEVIVGNIGSSKRSKYAVVGSGVNMTSRIESYTIGGQILISESVHQEAGEILHVLDQRDILPKGVETPLRVYEVAGIGEPYNLALQAKEVALVKLWRQIPLRYIVLEGKSVGDETLSGTIIQLSQNGAELRLETAAKPLTNLKMGLVEVDEKLSTRHFYGKVIEDEVEEGLVRFIRFTSVPPEIDAYFQAHRQHALETG
jgi:adenylate cyclase